MIWLNHRAKMRDHHVDAKIAHRRLAARTLKRTVDVVGSAVGLVLTSPILLLIAAAVWRSMGRPVFFRQVRPGRHDVPFALVKFRTMRNAVDGDGCPLPDEERLTPMGAFLRRTSLDEWPQLWNVFRGELSFVGPRPLLIDYLPLYTSEQGRRHEVRPGITGWAQVNGRNALTWEEKFALDVWYVDHWSFSLDLKILLSTVHKVITREGITGAGVPTTNRFTGSIRTDAAPSSQSTR